MNRDNLFHIAEDIATQPAMGECITGEWWAVHPEKGLLFFYRGRPAGGDPPAPQCNRSKSVAERLTAIAYPDHGVRQYPVVYLHHAEVKARYIWETRRRERIKKTVLVED